MMAKIVLDPRHGDPGHGGTAKIENASLHMKYNAIDFRRVSGNPAQWHEIAKAVRASAPRFKGGIGKYASFIHFDTRGHNANW
jgi:hypothetical protein